MESRVKRIVVCDDDNCSAFHCCKQTAFRPTLARTDLGRKTGALAAEELELAFEAFELVRAGRFRFDELAQL